MISTQPVWSTAALPGYSPFPGGRLRADVAVVGGGLTGLSAAYHLLARHPGRRVVVLEADTPGAGASGRSTGMLGPGVGQSLVSLVRRLGLETAGRLYRASLQAVEDVCRLVAEEAIDCQLHPGGQLVLARGRDGRRRLARQAALMKQLCLPVEVLDDTALERCLRLGPGVLSKGEGPAALRLPRAGILHPLRLVAGLAERVTRRGGLIFEQSRVREISRGQPVRLTLDGGEVCAGAVVLATAGYTPGLGLLRGRILPLELQALATEPLDGAALARLGWVGREGVVDSRRLFSYFRLTADSRIVFGGGRPRYHGAPAAAAGALDELAAQLWRTFPADVPLRIATGWTGVIDYTLDALPAIGRLPGRPHVLHVGGWCGHGIALGVAAGKWVAALLQAGATVEDLPWFRPRPPGLPLEALRRLAFAASVRLMDWLDGRA